MNKAKIRLILSTILTVAAIAIYLYYDFLLPMLEESAEVQSTEIVADDPVAYELPAISARQRDSVICHTGYTALYDEPRRIPRWVAYELSSEELVGNEERGNNFRPDPLWRGEQADTKDYTGSGYDRGHMAPAADMKWSTEAMHDSFYLTNICPQLHNLNAGDWKSLEELVRSLGEKYGSVYVVCGPIVGKAQGGRIGAHGVVVPDEFFKALLVRSGNKWHSIAFVMQNKAGKKPLMTYALTVNEVEAKTGLDLFCALPDDVEESVESQFDMAPWSLSR